MTFPGKSYCISEGILHNCLIITKNTCTKSFCARVLPNGIILQIPSVPTLGCSRKDITEHWEWLEQNLLQTLSIFENENDINTFVRGKIQVLYFLICSIYM